MPHLVAIVVTYHPDASVIDRIRRLAGQAGHVVIVDNTPDVLSRKLFSGAFASIPETVTFFFNNANFGVAAALNLGMRYAISCGAEWVLTMDQDSCITDGMIQVMLATYQDLPADLRQQTVSLAPVLVESEEDGVCAVVPIPSPSAHREISTAITSGNLIKSDAWQRIGGFEEKLFIDYVDHDFCFRLRRAGLKIVECRNARLIHRIGHARTIKCLGRKLIIDQHPPFRSYYILRNGLYFWRTFPEPDPFVRADKMNTLKLILKAILFDTRKAERMRMFWRGYRDFVRGHMGLYSDIHPKESSASNAVAP